VLKLKKGCGREKADKNLYNPSTSFILSREEMCHKANPYYKEVYFLVFPNLS
jgi:hypothetical protein